MARSGEIRIPKSDLRFPQVFPGPIFIWLLLQWAAWLLAGFRVPLAAQYPQPAEFQAVRVLLAVQFAWAAILLPVLLCNWRMTVLVIASAWVMLVLAAAMAAWPLAEILPAAGYLALWVVVLRTWNVAVPGTRGRMIATALWTIYAIGGALLWYLQLDFGAAVPPLTSATYGPLFLAVATPRHPALAGWTLLGVLQLAGSFIVGLARLRQKTLPNANDGVTAQN